MSTGIQPMRELRIVPTLGEISEHAKLLVTIAEAAHAVVREDFNGDDLIACPGQDWREVHQDWVQRRHARQAADKDRLTRLPGASA